MSHSILTKWRIPLDLSEIDLIAGVMPKVL